MQIFSNILKYKLFVNSDDVSIIIQVEQCLDNEVFYIDIQKID